MPTFSFPAATYAIEGDPEAVRETGRVYGRFATTAGEAGADLRGLDSGGWVGSEGDVFRARLGEIPPHLEVAHGAFAQVARALFGFADVLASAQGRVKHTPERIVAIGRDPSGRIVFLETGSPSAGLEHILLKKRQLAQRGIGEEQVADYVLTAVTKGKVVGMQRTRPIYEFRWDGASHRLAVTVGDNGFIVGANPVG